MKKYIPNIYKKSIFEIDYNILKKNNIKCIIFDLDNTLMMVSDDIPSSKVKKLVESLKKDFVLYIASNNKSKKRVGKVAEFLDIDYVNYALKPFSRGFKKIMKKENLKPEECSNIGDQIVTDVLAGNRLNMLTILIDPLSNVELKVTKFNRFFERRIVKKLDKKNLFKRGRYYG